VSERSEPRQRSSSDRGGRTGRSTDSESRTQEPNDRRPSARTTDKFQEKDSRAGGGFGAGIGDTLDDRIEEEPFGLGAELEAFDPLDDDPRDDLDAESISDEGSDGDDGRNTRRRRRRRVSKDRDNDEPKDRVKAGRREDDRDSDEVDADGDSDHAVRISKVPTWTETILVVVEANMVNHQKSPQSGRGPSRGRGRR